MIAEAQPVSGHKRPVDDPADRPDRMHSTDIKSELLGVCEQMVRGGECYDDDYFATTLDENATGHTMLYIMNVGDPGDPHRAPAKRKSVSAYFGCIGYHDTAKSHVDHHNNPDSVPKNSKTRPGAGRWTLCMIVAIPEQLVARDIFRTMHSYGETAHGISGKIRRATELITIFNLIYHVPPRHVAYVEALMQEQGDFLQRDQTLFRRRRRQ